MTLNLTIPQQSHTDFTPRITVIGVGGGGTNAVDNMIALNLQGVDFVVANTDAQQLMHSRSDRRIQLGPHITQGLGAGANPDIGRAAAEEAAEELYRHLDGTHMLFIAAGMGGGTGTGAAPVIARMARERGILTVGVVTKPFTFEGSRRARHADKGIEELQNYVDTLIVIPNQTLFRMSNERTTWKEAFKMADHVLYMGVRGVTDLMMTPGLVNLDFADVRTVMQEMGKAMMGTGEAEGENRAIRAAEAAISNPLLEDTSMSGARGLLINITGGDDLTLFEVDQAATRIGEEVAPDANIIFGSALDSSLQGKIRVSVVATGIDTPIDRSETQRTYMVVGGSDLVIDDAAGASLPGTAQTQTTIPPVSLRDTAPHVPPTVEAPAEPSYAPEQHGQQHGQQHDQHSGPQHGPQHGQQHQHPERRPQKQPPVIDLTPAEQPRQPPRAAHGGGLFAEAPRAAAASAPAMEPTGGSKPVSIFTRVTGLFRRGGGGGESVAAPAQRAEPAMSEPRVEARYEPRPMPRPAVNEEQVSEVPAFLRRQTS